MNKRTYFVTRHLGAIEWAQRHGFATAEPVSHFDPTCVQTGDQEYKIIPAASTK